MNRVYESMTCIRWGDIRIRVWREEPKFTRGPDIEVLQAYRGVPWNLETPLTEWMAAVVHIVGALPRVAAIEILDGEDNGGLFYPDWK